jgi:hypothetical protein
MRSHRENESGCDLRSDSLASSEPQDFAERRAKHENDDEGHANRDAHEQDGFRRGDQPKLLQRRRAPATNDRPSNSQLKHNPNDHGQNSENGLQVHSTSPRYFPAT